MAEKLDDSVAVSLVDWLELLLVDCKVERWRREKGVKWLNKVMGRCNMCGGEGGGANRKRKSTTSINKE